jgi:hypothetical protein
VGSPHTTLKRRVVAALRGAGCLVTSYDGSTAGVLDLFVCTPEGRYVELDIKAGRDKLSKIQHHRITQVQQAGGEAAEVRSVGEALWHCGLATQQTEPPPLKLEAQACPDCGAPTRAASGCLECPSCGWSACEV